MYKVPAFQRKGDHPEFVNLFVISIKRAYCKKYRYSSAEWWMVLEASPRASFHRQVKL